MAYQCITCVLIFCNFLFIVGVLALMWAMPPCHTVSRKAVNKSLMRCPKIMLAFTTLALNGHMAAAHCLLLLHFGCVITR